MGAELQHSALFEEVLKIANQPGSPYFRVSIVIHAGGKDIVPLKSVRWDIERDYTGSWSDATSVTVYLGAGTLMMDISPFQDDLRITILSAPMTERGYEDTSSAVFAMTYKAYLGDDTETTAEAGNDISMQDKETADRTSIRAVNFVLEEVAVSQFRKQSTGTIGEITPPCVVLETLINRACQALVVDQADKILKVDMVPANNMNPRDIVIVPDNTPMHELPDHIQNKEGGVYSTGLGFYIQSRIVYLWPVYDLSRYNQAARVIQVFMAPNKSSQLIDRTWMDQERTLKIYTAGIAKTVDESVDLLNNEGGGTRFTMASRLVDAPVQVGNNKMVASRTQNNSEYAATVLGDGQALLRNSSARVTDNAYLEASKLAKRSSVNLIVTWLRSNPQKITPGMPAEIVYDYNGEIQTLPGVLKHALHSYEFEGQGMTGERFRAKSVLTFSVDRNSPEYRQYINAGGQVTPMPEYQDIVVE